jgi:3-deoxy-D-manno-octulosonate 8-phosphate phosphatase KdsC-like HAD superfamily phosphatase
MSVLDDSDREKLLEAAGLLTDQAANVRDQLRTSLFMLGLPVTIADATVTIAEHLEELAFQRGRTLAMLEHCDTLDRAGIDVQRGGGGS